MRAREALPDFSIVLGAAAALAGCGTSTAPAGGPTQYYDLVALEVDERRTLPTADPTTPEVTVLSGALVLAGDGSCLRRMEIRIETQDGASDESVNWMCRWAAEDGGLRLEWPGGLPDAHATLTDDVLTLLIDTGVQCVTTPCPSGWTEVYERRGP